MSSRRSPSPILGYNHNLRHGGRVFHIQTEDSGPGYARLYTHLFYEGTILSSKKQEYDAEAHETVVRAAMQKLHKLMIIELTHAEHDARLAGARPRGWPLRRSGRLVRLCGRQPRSCPVVRSGSSTATSRFRARHPHA